MIYFVVNNNYHFIDFLKHVESIKKIDSIGLIQIPHTLEVLKENQKDYDVYLFENFNLYKSIKNKNWEEAKNKIENVIKPKKNDIIIIYTEFEIMNLYLLEYFKNKGAKALLLEEGIATYLESCYNNNERVSIKRIILFYLLKIKFEFRNIVINKSKTLSPFFIKDELLDGLITYFNIKTHRKIKQYFVKKDCLILENLNDSKILFLNEDTYNFYENFECYIKNLEFILDWLHNNFDEIIFKFHPREYKNLEKLQEIIKVIKKYPKVNIFDGIEPIEIVIDKVKSKFVVSYMSVALINLRYNGLEPIYLYPLFKEFEKETDFINLTKLLKDLNYNFIINRFDINKNYKCGLELSKSIDFSLGDIILEIKKDGEINESFNNNNNSML